MDHDFTIACMRKICEKKKMLLLSSIISISYLASCSNIEESLPGNKTENPDNFKLQPVISVENKSSPIDPLQEKIVPVEVKGHSLMEHDIGDLVNQEKKKTSQPDRTPFYAYFEKQQKDFKDANHITMSYNAAPIGVVVPAFSKALGCDFYLDPQIKGVVTMSIDSNLTKEDLWQIFEQILQINGAYCSLENGIVKVLPVSDMIKGKLTSSTISDNSNVSVILFRLKNIKSVNLIQQIKPFLTDGAVVIDIADQNSIVITELASNMQEIQTIINMLDVNNKYSWPKIVLKCSNISVSSVANDLTKILPVLGFPVNCDQVRQNSSNPADDKDNIGAIDLQPIDRLQLLVVTAANSEAITEVEKWVSILDRNDVGDQDQIFIYKVQNASADDLVQSMSALFNVQVSTLTPKASTQNSSSTPKIGSSSSGSSTGSSPSMRATAYDLSQTSSSNSSIQSSSISQNGNDGNPPSIYDLPIKVMADTKNQRLLIRSTPRAYAIIKSFLAAIDTMPQQVLLSVTVADITLENNLDIGIQAAFKAGNENTLGTDYGMPNSFPAGDGASWVLNSKNANATFNALQIDKKLTTLAKPEILVQSHSPASISIGQSVPINTGSTNSGQGGTTTSYDYKDVGIIVNMTPHVTQGKLINLEFSQTNSKIDQSTTTDSSSAGGNPTFTQEVLNTVMNVPDGGTIVIGGLVKNDTTDSLDTVPFISNIPVLNRMVGNTSIKKTRSEMLVMVTANIVTKTSDLEQMTERYQNSVKLIKDSFSKDEKDNSEVFKAEDSNKLYIKGD